MKNRVYYIVAILFLVTFVTTFNYGGCGGGGSSSGSSAPVVIAPAAPSNFTEVSSIYDTTTDTLQTLFNWTDNSTNETGFFLEFSNITNWIPIVTATANTTNAIITWPDLWNVYPYGKQYRIRTYNSAGSSVSNTITMVSSLNVPSNFAAGAVTKPGAFTWRIPFTWTDNSSNEDGFIIRWSTGKSYDIPTPNSTGITLDFNFNPSGYEFTISAYNDAGYAGAGYAGSNGIIIP